MRDIARAAYRSGVLPVLAAAGVFRLMRWSERSAALILLYHGVGASESGEELVNPNHIDVTSFRWQMEFLRENYTVVPLSDIVHRVKRNLPIDRLAAVTFDDGYLGVYEYAAPVLKDLGMPATTFVISGCVEQGVIPWYDLVEAHFINSRLSQLRVGGTTYDLANRREAVRSFKRRIKRVGLDERDELIAELAAAAGPLAASQLQPYALMGWHQMRELQSQLMDFGPHTHSHPHLSKVPHGSARAALEIDEASMLVSERLFIPVRDMIFCYPDGDYDSAARDRVENLGLAGAVAVKNALARTDDDPFALARVGVAGGDSRAAFQDATVGLTRRLKAAFTPRPR